MLNIISSDVPIHMEYQEEISQFLMNAITLTVAKKEKNFETFIPEAKELMKNEPTWLEDTVSWLQSMVINSLAESGNYKSLKEVIQDFDSMVNLYQKARKRKPTQSEAGQFVGLHDKLLVLLLSDEELLRGLGLLV